MVCGVRGWGVSASVLGLVHGRLETGRLTCRKADFEDALLMEGREDDEDQRHGVEMGFYTAMLFRGVLLVVLKDFDAPSNTSSELLSSSGDSNHMRATFRSLMRRGTVSL